MVFDTAKLKNRKSTIQPSTSGRDAAKELTLKKNIFKGIHDRFLRDQVYREPQLKIGWTEQKCTEMDELSQQDHMYRLSRRGIQKIPRTVTSHIA